MKFPNIFKRFQQVTLTKKTLAWVLFGIFVFCVLPLVVISFYNRAAADDYSYSVLTVHAWRETGNVLAVLAAAWQTVTSFYNVWQGTFSAVFLFALQPSIFGDKLYFLTTLLLLGMFIGSTGYLLHVLLVRYLGADKWTWAIVTLMILIVSIELLPSANEAFYWYNGGVYYTFFYSAMLFLVGLILSWAKTKKKGSFIALSILIPLLAFFISGGNYTTALITCILLAAFSIMFFLKKKHNAWVIAVAFVFALSGLLISGLAPGNVYRAASLTPMGPVEAVIRSLYNGVIYIANWTNLVIVAMALLLFPLLWQLVRKSSFSFKYSWLVILASYFLFSAQLTPPLFAMSDLGSPRQADIYYFTFVLLFLIDWTYVIGWLSHKAEKPVFAWEEKERLSLSMILIPVVIAVVGLMTRGIVGIKAMPTFSALISLIKGDAQTFALEMDARIALFENPTILDVVVQPLTVIPPLFHPETLSTNGALWPNVDIARYYDKTTITLVSETLGAHPRGVSRLPNQGFLSYIPPTHSSQNTQSHF